MHFLIHTFLREIHVLGVVWQKNTFSMRPQVPTQLGHKSTALPKHLAVGSKLTE